MIAKKSPSGETQLGIINVQKMKGDGPFNLEPVTLEEVSIASSRLGEISDLLHELLPCSNEQGGKT